MPWRTHGQISSCQIDVFLNQQSDDVEAFRADNPTNKTVIVRFQANPTIDPNTGFIIPGATLFETTFAPGATKQNSQVNVTPGTIPIARESGNIWWYDCYSETVIQS